MYLRSLELKDAPLMLEWMHDERVNRFYRFSASKYTLEQVEDFISISMQQSELEKPSNIHYAITENGGEYLGTISLKKIDYVNKNAEYAIVLRFVAQRKGLAFRATQELFKIAFEQLGLHRIYLNVLADNSRAINVYRKIGFIYEGEWKDHLLLRGEWKSLSWYAMTREIWEKQQG